MKEVLIGIEPMPLILPGVVIINKVCVLCAKPSGDYLEHVQKFHHFLLDDRTLHA